MMRRLLAIRLRRLADRLDPQPEVSSMLWWKPGTVIWDGSSTTSATTVTYLTGGK